MYGNLILKGILDLDRRSW